MTDTYTLQVGHIRLTFRCALDGFVTKLESSGQQLAYSSYLGGNADDGARGVAVDGIGNTYAAGLTKGTNFPLSHAFQPIIGGSWDAFATKIGRALRTFVSGTQV
jgi:hypothetical protein